MILLKLLSVLDKNANFQINRTFQSRFNSCSFTYVVNRCEANESVDYEYDFQTDYFDWIEIQNKLLTWNINSLIRRRCIFLIISFHSFDIEWLSMNKLYCISNLMVDFLNDEVIWKLQNSFSASHPSFDNFK